MIVTWATMDYTGDSIVEYNKKGGPLDMKAIGTVDEFVDGSASKRKVYMHRVKLTGLVPLQSYGRQAMLSDCYNHLKSSHVICSDKI